MVAFEYIRDYDDILAQIATESRVDADWRVLKEMIKYKLGEAVSVFLSLGPPWPLEPEAARDAVTRASELLDRFLDQPPFTVQRLAELVLHPRDNYSSLPKYLRAVNKVINVSTDPELKHYEPNDGSGEPTAHELAARGRRHSTASASSSSSSNHNMPLLSPIPWLRISSDTEDPVDDITPLLSNGVSQAAASGQHNGSPTRSTATPTGGLVDEVDPGTGSSEPTNPVSLTHSVTLTGSAVPNGSDSEDSAMDGLRPESGASAESLSPERKELNDRFVRASSPRVISPTEQDKPLLDGSPATAP